MQVCELYRHPQHLHPVMTLRLLSGKSNNNHLSTETHHYLINASMYSKMFSLLFSPPLTFHPSPHPFVYFGSCLFKYLQHAETPLSPIREAIQGTLWESVKFPVLQNVENYVSPSMNALALLTTGSLGNATCLG